LNDATFFGSIQGRALVAGRRIGATYGEAFQLLAPLGLSSLDILVPGR
jgi:hypothetical protein